METTIGLWFAVGSVLLAPILCDRISWKQVNFVEIVWVCVFLALILCDRISWKRVSQTGRSTWECSLHRLIAIGLVGNQ
ncbi:hypothetical protein NIES2104_56290 [Leptolyngbya sp. NIES-2104]|nr:hypothetical protein NIES2104_56290 [Leptolyngbya sp. NIES-2104]